MNRNLLIIALLVLFVLLWNPPVKYDTKLSIDPGFVLEAVGENKNEFVNMLIDDFQHTKDYWAKGDTLLVLARLEYNDDYYKLACDNYLKYSPKTKEESALLYETLASLNCRGRRIHYLRQAAHYWKLLDVQWRADILENLARNKSIDFEFDTSQIEPNINLEDANSIIIGTTKVEIKNNDKIVTQTDRVLRDWLGIQLRQTPFRGEILKVFSERLRYTEERLMAPVGWHEGGRLRDIQKYVDITHIPAVGTLVAKKDNKWYASDENGVFRFEVPKDKVSYPTTRFLASNLAVIVDSHGINMLVEQAIRNNADVVIGCCDSPGKVKAVKYLSDKGISSLCFTDLDLYRALGNDVKAVGSAPFAFKDNKVIFGDLPLTIYTNEDIVVADADIGKTHAIWYYAAPKLYFEEISKTFRLNVHAVPMAEFNLTKKIFDKAREIDARLVGSRVYEAEDYNEAKQWLKESRDNRLILFHSMSYPYGLLISQEFRNQVSFDDPNIIIGE